MYRVYFKRVFDLIVALIGIIVLFPILLLISLWIKMSSKGPIFYAQKRVGKDFKEFYIYKFRSMVLNADKIGPNVTSADDSRITKVGKFIRKTKIDELPQLFNVIRGEMSLVGPRPEVIKFVEKNRDAYEKVLSVRPGITDNAAIEFRDEETLMNQYKDKEKAYLEYILPKKIKLYYNYIDNITFLNDIKLILKTLKVL